MRLHTPPDCTSSERRDRVVAAFSENGIGSTGTLVAVMSAIYRHAPDALGHAQRVAAVCLRIGQELRFTARELEHLERAAWLHDLGRFVAPEPPGDPDAASDDAVDVSTDRWARQVDIAVEIIATVPVLQPAAALVRASRECIDGSGYPRGLRGGEI